MTLDASRKKTMCLMGASSFSPFVEALNSNWGYKTLKIIWKSFTFFKKNLKILAIDEDISLTTIFQKWKLIIRIFKASCAEPH